jgi:hypothetical protein
MSNKLPTTPKKGNLPPAQLPAATTGQLPAVAKATHPVRALKDFAADADDLAEHYGKLQKARQNIRNVRQTPIVANAQKYLDEAGALLTRHEKYFRKEAEKLELALNQRFSPDDAYDDDCRLLEARVREAIALLLASFPNANPGNSEAYVGMMVEEVMAEDDVSLVVLESACSQIRRTSKFPPTTAEVIEAIREQVELWEPRLNAIHSCEHVVGWIRDELTAAQDELTIATAVREERARIAEEKKRADDELRAQPLIFGARVRYRTQPFKMYTIIAEHDAWKGGGNFLAWSDETNDTVLVGGPELQRAIPGDYNFETPAEVRAMFATDPSVQRKRRPVVGDRVTDDICDWTDPEFPPQGAGTVVFAGGPDGYRDCFDIQFDNGTFGEDYMTYQLNRLLPDDPDFERSENVAAGWRAWELKQADVEAGEKSAATTAGACQEYSAPDERAE